MFEKSGGMAGETGKGQIGSNFDLWVSVCGPHLLASESLGVGDGDYPTPSNSDASINPYLGNVDGLIITAMGTEERE